MRKATGWMAGVALLATALAGCTGGGDPWQDRPGPKVLAFFPPLYSLAGSVAGDDAQVLPLLTTKGPHDYEPKPSDARKLRRADLLLVNGLGLDDAVAAKLAETCGNPNLKTVKLAERIPESTLFPAGLCSCGHDHADGTPHDHAHGAHDPHVWLGIPEAVVFVEGIRDELTKLDPTHADGYRQRAAALTDRLHTLQADGKAALAAKTEKARLLTHHDALRYFARTFGAEVVDAISLSGGELSSKRLNELVKLCQEKHVRLIAVEPQFSVVNSGAQAILRELHRKGVADAAFVEIDTLETADPTDLTADFYERKMRANLDALAGALK